MLIKYYILFSAVMAMMYAVAIPYLRANGSAPLHKIIKRSFDPGTGYKVHYPSVKNIHSGRVVLINGYNLGLTMMAIATVSTDGLPKFPQNDLRSGDFYTNAYRWALRAISLVPEWLAGGASAIYPESQRVWRKRFYYMEEEVPQWLRSILFFVNDWDRDVWARKRYNTVAKPAFDKHLRYPSPIASENFASFRVTKETVENVDDSEFETVAPRSMNWSILPKSPWSYSMTPYRNEIYDIKYVGD